MCASHNECDVSCVWFHEPCFGIAGNCANRNDEFLSIPLGCGVVLPIIRSCVGYAMAFMYRTTYLWVSGLLRYVCQGSIAKEPYAMECFHYVTQEFCDLLLCIYSRISVCQAWMSFLSKWLNGSRNVGRIRDGYAKQKNKLIIVGVLSRLWMERKEGFRP